MIKEATARNAMKLALGKIISARECHPNAVDALLFEAEEILEEALAEQPAQPQQEPCKHEPVYDNLFAAGYTFCKHCHKQWTTSMEGNT